MLLQESVLLAEVGRRLAKASGVSNMKGSLVELRELEASDAASLFEAIATPQVSRFLPPALSTFEGVQEFIATMHRQQVAGQAVSFAILPRGADVPIGLFEIRSLEPRFALAEWRFAVAPEYWGSGVFADSATLVADYAFETLGAQRLEARAPVVNKRGNAALRKIGAIQEALLRRSFVRNGEQFDQILWTIRADDWMECRRRATPLVVH